METSGGGLNAEVNRPDLETDRSPPSRPELKASGAMLLLPYMPWSETNLPLPFTFQLMCTVATFRTARRGTPIGSYSGDYQLLFRDRRLIKVSLQVF